MFVRVVELWRTGQKRPDIDRGADPGVIGELRMGAYLRGKDRVPAKRMTLQAPETMHVVHALPPLLDPRMEGLGHDGFNVWGLQRCGGAFVVQQWICELVPQDPRELCMRHPRARYGDKTVAQAFPELAAALKGYGARLPGAGT
jgi:hypothetical protein